MLRELPSRADVQRPPAKQSSATQVANALSCDRAVATAIDDELRDKPAESGIEVAPSTPEELQQLIANDIRVHAELVKAAGLVPQ